MFRCALILLWVLSAGVVGARAPAEVTPDARAWDETTWDETTWNETTRNETTWQVTAPHVAVLFDDLALAPYAQRVAAVAEVELLRVSDLFRREPIHVTLRLDTTVDRFNAFALPIPRPQVVLRTVAPLDGAIGRQGDLLARVVRHELTHLIQLTDTRVPDGAGAPPAIGLVGEGTAVLPPAWFLEGIATWVESQVDGGRLDAPRTRSLLWTLAADGAFPSLADVSLTTYGAWPFGEARYLLGATFVQALVARHGWQALLDTLRVYQAGGGLRSFASAWQGAVGTSLAAEWGDLGRALTSQAADQTWADRPETWTRSGGPTGAGAMSPSGDRLAWVDKDGVRVADLDAAGLGEPRLVAADVAPESLTWLDASTLVWSAVARDPGARPTDLFAFDLDRRRVRRLTYGAHAHLPRADGSGCLLYVTDTILAGSALMRWCEAGSESVYRADVGSHVVGLAVDRRGQIALSVAVEGVVEGPAVRLELLTPDGPQRLAPDAALGNLVDPVWEDAGTLLVAADGTGTWQVYRLHLEEEAWAAAQAPTATTERAAQDGAVSATLTPRGARLTPRRVRSSRLSQALGGAEQPLATPAGVLARSLGGSGYDLVRLAAAGDGSALPLVAGPLRPEPTATPTRSGPPPSDPTLSAPTQPVTMPSAPTLVAEPYPEPYPVTPYEPWTSLLPYGWLPNLTRASVAPLGVGLELLVPALDDSGQHALALTVGYDTSLHGPVGGAYGSLRYAWNMPNQIPALSAPPPLGVALQVGAWPHRVHLAATTEVAYGVRSEALLRVPVGAYDGAFGVRADVVGAPSLSGWLLEGRMDWTLSGLRADRFGALDGGSAFALRLRWTAAPAGPSAGAWGEALWLPRVGEVPLMFGLRAGYRPLVEVPVALSGWAAMASLGTRGSVPLAWRWDDGLVALERLDLEPTLRLWGTADGPIRIGADVALWANTVIAYNGSVRVGLRAGYADGWWSALALDLPF